MNSEQEFVGWVEAGRFRPFGADPMSASETRLTAIQMQAAMSPTDLDLNDYEVRVVVARGHGSIGNWIYSASVVESAGPALSSVLRRLYDDSPGMG